MRDLWSKLPTIHDWNEKIFDIWFEKHGPNTIHDWNEKIFDIWFEKHSIQYAQVKPGVLKPVRFHERLAHERLTFESLDEINILVDAQIADVVIAAV
jgi:hypothetical protein